jgi:hypothetical protein
VTIVASRSMMRRASGLTGIIPKLVQAVCQYEIALREFECSRSSPKPPLLVGALSLVLMNPGVRCTSHPVHGVGLTSLEIGSWTDRVSTSCCNNHRYRARRRQGTPQQLRCFHPGVDQGDQLYLPSAPGTPKSGAPPQSWI